MATSQTLRRRWSTAARWPLGVVLAVWRYLWSTTPVHRWEMRGSWPADAPPELPSGVDCDGLQRMEDGVGPLMHRIYRTRIVGSALTPAQMMARVAEDLDRVAPSEFATFQRLEGEEGGLRVGESYVVRMPGPWDGPVRVIAADATSFSLATLPGHLEAGQIEFRVSADYRSLWFEIESWARSGDRLSDLLYTHLRFSKEVQLHMWCSVLRKIVALAGGRMEGGIVVTTRTVAPDGLAGEADSSGRFGERRLGELSRERQRVAPPGVRDAGALGRERGPGALGRDRDERGAASPAGRLLRLARRLAPSADRLETRELAALANSEFNFAAADIASAPGQGWRVDDMVEQLPQEGSGPPAEGGSWQAARQIMDRYQLADPRLVAALYDEESPLEGRDMLLRVRFAGLRINAGVRVGWVHEGRRRIEGRDAQVSGWSYRTLEGHFEEGVMRYELWKWLDSGEVEFHLRAVSRPARSGPFLSRTGFRLIGRPRQLRFFRHACRRIRRLTEAQLEAERAASRATGSQPLEPRPGCATGG